MRNGKLKFNERGGAKMLVPAITRKQEILDNFKKYYYSTDMMYETGSMNNWLPNIQEEPNESRFQYAVVGKKDNLIGYIDYSIDWYASCARNFGMISFDRGNPLMGKAIFEILETLINEYHLHRIEWRMVGGNPVEKHYDKFCKKYGGTKHILRDACKDRHGKYHNDVVYEIVRQTEI